MIAETEKYKDMENNKEISSFRFLQLLSFLYFSKTEETDYDKPPWLPGVPGGGGGGAVVQARSIWTPV